MRRIGRSLIVLGAGWVLWISLAVAQESKILPDWTGHFSLPETGAGKVAALEALLALPPEFYEKPSGDAAAPRGWLGVTLKEHPAAGETAVIEITRVFPGSPAGKAGLRAGDRILDWRAAVESGDPDAGHLTRFRQAVAGTGPGGNLQLTIERAGRRREWSVKLGAPPSAPVRLRPFARRPPPPREAPSLLHHALRSLDREADFRAYLAALRARAGEVVSTAVRGGTFNPFRLSLVSSLLHRPFDLPREGDRLAASFGSALAEGAPDPAAWIERAAEVLDAPLVPAEPGPPVKDFDDWLARLVAALQAAQDLNRQATAGLSADELIRLESWVLDWMRALERQEQPEAEAKRAEERRTLEWLHLALKVDLGRLLKAARDLAAALDPRTLETLPVPDLASVHFPDGWVVTPEPDRLSLQTPAGRVLIGGGGSNRYTGEAVLIVDLGGDDVYLNGAGGARPGRPVSVLVDFRGDDRYLAREPFAQGGALFGTGFLLDLAGDDVYVAEDLAQGAGVFGIGGLFDRRGRDRYLCRAFCQGAALLGAGALAESAGDDHFSASLFAQGFGFIRGVGTLAEAAGDDAYFAGGRVEDFRQPGKATQSLAQGFGYGLRPWDSPAGASGGIGLLVDRAGNDKYSADYFAQGASYWLALGVLHDGAGHDQYLAGRYAQGAGIHYSVGLLLDAAGEDVYQTHFGVSQGCGHDFGVGQLVDLGGNDRYLGGVLSQGVGNGNGLGLLVDTAGQDLYGVTGRGRGWGHWDPLRKLGSFGFFVDAGGRDHYLPEGKDDRLEAPTPWSLRADIN